MDDIAWALLICLIGAALAAIPISINYENKYISHNKLIEAKIAYYHKTTGELTLINLEEVCK